MELEHFSFPRSGPVRERGVNAIRHDSARGSASRRIIIIRSPVRHSHHRTAGRPSRKQALLRNTGDESRAKFRVPLRGGRCLNDGDRLAASCTPLVIDLLLAFQIQSCRYRSQLLICAVLHFASRPRLKISNCAARTSSAEGTFNPFFQIQEIT
jgi:hypothetical protein